MLLIRILICSFVLLGIAQAQDTCLLPQRIDPPRLQKMDCQNRQSPDSYVLSLSWSPEYCASADLRRTSNRFQCLNNRFEFVVHGLWGQNRQARNKCEQPRNCSQSLVSETTLRKTLCTIPSVDLIQGEWQKHGSCTGMSEAEYFAKTTELWNQLAKPDLSRLLDGRGQTRVQDIVTAFTVANRTTGLNARAVRVQTSRNGYLEEVHICYNLDFKFDACDKPGASPRQSVRVELPR